MPGSLLDDAALRLLAAFHRRLGEPPVRFAIWDGRAVGCPESEAEGCVRLHDRGALLALLRDADFQFGELFCQGRLSVEGDLVALLRIAFRHHEGGGVGATLRRLLRRAPRNDLAAALENARHHYDRGNEFYRLWLDERMVYTCAYFPRPEDSLEEAQLAKLDHVCRKLRLRPGEHVVEAGCGWGALALHMARHYGVTVTALNVSEPQLAWAREQAEKENLEGRVEFVLDDYRNATTRCDAFVSVGMLEHVGHSHYPALGRVIDRSLASDGRGLIHNIGRGRPQRLNPWTELRVFPNAHPPTLREMMDVFEGSGLVVLDVENLRRHYALTVRHWLARYRAERPRIVELVGEEMARTFELYLAGTIASFEASTIELFQVVFTRAGNDRIPWTRAGVYCDEA